MKLCCSLLFIVVLSAFCARSVSAQEDQDNYFTGTLMENAADHLKVSRVLQGKSEDHVFKINAQTKIEGGRLRLRERITVRYVSGEDSDTAILIIVRPATPQPKKQK